MYAKFMTLKGEVEAFYDWHDVSAARIYWARRWWQFSRRPVEDARLIQWCIEYLRATKQK